MHANPAPLGTTPAAAKALGTRSPERTPPSGPSAAPTRDAEAHDFPYDCGAQDAGSDFGSACTCLACSRYLKYVEVHA